MTASVECSTKFIFCWINWIENVCSKLPDIIMQLSSLYTTTFNKLTRSYSREHKILLNYVLKRRFRKYISEMERYVSIVSKKQFHLEILYPGHSVQYTSSIDLGVCGREGDMGTIADKEARGLSSITRTRREKIEKECCCYSGCTWWLDRTLKRWKCLGAHIQYVGDEDVFGAWFVGAKRCGIICW